MRERDPLGPVGTVRGSSEQHTGLSGVKPHGRSSKRNKSPAASRGQGPEWRDREKPEGRASRRRGVNPRGHRACPQGTEAAGPQGLKRVVERAAHAGLVPTPRNWRFSGG